MISLNQTLEKQVELGPLASVTRLINVADMRAAAVLRDLAPSIKVAQNLAKLVIGATGMAIAVFPVAGASFEVMAAKAVTGLAVNAVVASSFKK